MKGNSKLISVHAVKIHSESKVIVPLILNLGPTER